MDQYESAIDKSHDDAANWLAQLMLVNRALTNLSSADDDIMRGGADVFRLAIGGIQRKVESLQDDICERIDQLNNIRKGFSRVEFTVTHERQEKVRDKTRDKVREKPLTSVGE